NKAELLQGQEVGVQDDQFPSVVYSAILNSIFTDPVGLGSQISDTINTAARLLCNARNIIQQTLIAKKKSGTLPPTALLKKQMKVGRLYVHIVNFPSISYRLWTPLQTHFNILRLLGCCIMDPLALPRANFRLSSVKYRYSDIVTSRSNSQSDRITIIENHESVTHHSNRLL
ncbi:hypothetical protein BX616_002087, partial [Lobosporangium transversale]